MFPPGFENSIPAHVRCEKERKRREKLEKKRKLKEEASRKHAAAGKTSMISVNSIQVDDVIKMANDMGLSFKGPEAELKARIEEVLHNQRLNWEANCS